MSQATQVSCCTIAIASPPLVEAHKMRYVRSEASPQRPAAALVEIQMKPLAGGDPVIITMTTTGMIELVNKCSELFSIYSADMLGDIGVLY
ncbi:hypothetical protein ABIB66_007588 [Bradyrhizobium sp. F1.13.3]